MFYDDTKISLIRDDEYWGKALFGKLPEPKYIVHPIFKANDAANLAFKDGQIDMTQAFIPKVWSMWEEGAPIKTYLDETPYFLPGAMPSIFFNLSKKGLDVPEVRRAIAMCIDYDKIAEVAMSGYSSDIQPSLILLNSEAESKYIDKEAIKQYQWQFDIDGANALLDFIGAEKGSDGIRVLKDGTRLGPFEAECPYGWSDWNASLEIVAQSAKKIGIEIRTKFPEAPVWTNNRQTGNFDITMNSPASALKPSQPWDRARYDSIRILMKSPKFVIGSVLFIAILALILIYPMINKNDPFDMVAGGFEAPTSEYILGTYNFGRDVFLELMYGTRTSLYVGLVGGMVATLIGLTLGLSSGYIGGIVDNIITTITNIFIVIPSFIILILVSVSIDSRSSTITALIIGFTSWPWTARAVRAQTSSLRNRDHVSIAKITGYGTLKIIIFEILTYIASYIVMAFILQTASGILQEASISMLGLGPFNTISLGVMMNWALMFEAPAAGAWWAFVPIALIIASVTFALYIMNMGMDEIFNPKIRS